MTGNHIPRHARDTFKILAEFQFGPPNVIYQARRSWPDFHSPIAQSAKSLSKPFPREV